MNLKKIFTALLLVLMIPAQANEESIRSSIQNQINQRHPSLPSGFWEGLGTAAIPVIKQMYAESTSANEKTFLIDGLGHFDDPSVAAFLENEVKATQNEVLRKKLLSAVIQSEGERAFEFVEPYLKDSDGHIRLSVARGLMAHEQNEKIKKRMAEFKAKEKSSWVLADLKKLGPTESLQKTRKQLDASPVKDVGTVKPVMTTKIIPPLPEKNWAGIWRGTYVTENKMILMEANLVLADSNSNPLKWRVEYKMPKQVKQEWKSGEFTTHYFQTNRAHWIELRNAKLDIVFLAQRKSL
jgi:hypothetical protein